MSHPQVSHAMSPMELHLERLNSLRITIEQAAHRVTLAADLLMGPSLTPEEFRESGKEQPAATNASDAVERILAGAERLHQVINRIAGAA